MNENPLKTCVTSIQMPADAKRQLVQTLTARPAPKKRFFAPIRKIPVVAVLLVLCFFCSVPVLAASIDPLYQLMYRFSPGTAQFFRPVAKSDVSNGIEMTVLSSYIHGDTAEIYLSLQDLEGDRLDATTDLNDSYTIHTPFDCSAYSELVSYDEATKTATLRVSISQTDGSAVQGDKITFSTREIISQKAEMLGAEVPLDLQNLPQNAATSPVYVTGVGSSSASMPDFDDFFDALVPQEPKQIPSVENITLTGTSFADGKLHIQLAAENTPQTNSHAFLWLETADGTEISCDYSVSFYEESAGQRTDYTEFIFSVTPEELSSCRVIGDFFSYGVFTEGDWSVTFPLEAEE